MNRRSNYPARFSFMCWYVAITFLWSWGLWSVMIFLHLKPFSHLWGAVYAVGLSGPFVAATYVKWKEQGLPGVRSLFQSLTQWRVNPTVYLIALLAAPAVTLFAAADFSPFLVRSSTVAVWSSVPLLVIKMALRGGPLNEEPGWRGYFLPALLTRLSPFTASLVVWVVWGTWHVPLWFVPGVAHPDWPMGLFMLLLLPVTFLFTALHRMSRGSVLIAILFHTMINLAIFFAPMLTIYQSGITLLFLRLNVLWFVVCLIVMARQSGWWFKRPHSFPDPLETANQQATPQVRSTGEIKRIVPAAN